MIGLFDSGLGGLSVLNALRARLPTHDLLYLADSAYCPYGPRPLAEIRARARFCANALVAAGAELVVVACNTATAAAVHLLRAELTVPVVGMEPGVKPAAALTTRGVVGVLATETTLRNERFDRLVAQFAPHLRVVSVAAPQLVTLVEAGELAGPRAEAVVRSYLAPILAADADTLVLGCTHFPFLRPLISRLAPQLQIVDTGPAVAARTAALATAAMLPSGHGQLRLWSSGDPALVAPVARRLLGSAITVEPLAASGYQKVYS